MCKIVPTAKGMSTAKRLALQAAAASGCVMHQAMPNGACTMPAVRADEGLATIVACRQASARMSCGVPYSASKAHASEWSRLLYMYVLYLQSPNRVHSLRTCGLNAAFGTVPMPWPQMPWYTIQCCFQLHTGTTGAIIHAHCRMLEHSFMREAHI